MALDHMLPMDLDDEFGPGAEDAAAFPLDTFLIEYATDDNVWWRLETGEMQAMFDALLERLEKANAEIDRLTR